MRERPLVPLGTSLAGLRKRIKRPWRAKASTSKLAEARVPGSVGRYELRKLKDILRLWFGLHAAVGRKAYVLSGFGLMALKFGVDFIMVFAATERAINPLLYLSPVFAHRQEFVDSSAEWLMIWMAIWALPFAWIGLSMSIRRAVDAGFAGFLGLLFFMPGLNFLLMAGLSLAPTKDVAAWEQEVHSPPVELARLKTAMIGTGVGFAIGMLMTLISTLVLGEYGSVLFVLTPVMMGAAGAFVHNRPNPRTLSSSVLVAMMSITIVGGVLLLTAVEGVICLAMAFPLAAVMAFFGAVVGRALALQTATNTTQALIAVLCLPMLGFVEPGTHSEHLFESRSAIEIDAPASAVWPNVIGFTELPEPSEWFFNLGIAYPQRARIEGEGVGAVRYCEFSTGPFVEPITAWDPPNRLSFDVESQPPPMTELSPYRNLHPPHLDGYMRSRRGEFRLIPLPNGRTRLEGSTWYELDVFPSSYWSLFSQALIGSIHDRVLLHIKNLTEAERQAG